LGSTSEDLRCSGSRSKSYRFRLLVWPALCQVSCMHTASPVPPVLRNGSLCQALPAIAAPHSGLCMPVWVKDALPASVRGAYAWQSSAESAELSFSVRCSTQDLLCIGCRWRLWHVPQHIGLDLPLTVRGSVLLCSDPINIGCWEVGMCAFVQLDSVYNYRTHPKVSKFGPACTCSGSSGIECLPLIRTGPQPTSTVTRPCRGEVAFASKLQKPHAKSALMMDQGRSYSEAFLANARRHTDVALGAVVPILGRNRWPTVSSIDAPILRDSETRVQVAKWHQSTQGWSRGCLSRQSLSRGGRSILHAPVRLI
jgi:hypothetical protein